MSLKTNNKVVNYVTICGCHYAVPKSVKLVLECSRGFLYFETNVLVNEDAGSSHWQSTRVNLHSAVGDSNMSWPVRIKADKRAHSEKTYICEERPLDDNVKIIDCSNQSY